MLYYIFCFSISWDFMSDIPKTLSERQWAFIEWSLHTSDIFKQKLLQVFCSLVWFDETVKDTLQAFICPSAFSLQGRLEYLPLKQEDKVCQSLLDILSVEVEFDDARLQNWYSFINYLDFVVERWDDIVLCDRTLTEYFQQIDIRPDQDVYSVLQIINKYDKSLCQQLYTLIASEWWLWQNVLSATTQQIDESYHSRAILTFLENYWCIYSLSNIALNNRGWLCQRERPWWLLGELVESKREEQSTDMEVWFRLRCHTKDRIMLDEQSNTVKYKISPTIYPKITVFLSLFIRKRKEREEKRDISDRPGG